MTTGEMDQARAEAFAERMLGIVNDAAIALMTSIGHRTGLFDAMAGLHPLHQRADRLRGRPRRALRARVAGTPWSWAGSSSTTRRRNVPSTPGARGLADQGGLTRQHRRRAQVHPASWRRWRTGSSSASKGRRGAVLGLPRFHEVMAEDSGQTVVAALTDHILPLVPGLTERLEDGIDVLDVGCGSGRALNLMARNVPQQPLRRLRLLRGGHRPRPRRGRRARPPTSASRSRTRQPSARRTATTSSPPSTRSTTRPSPRRCSKG